MPVVTPVIRQRGVDIALLWSMELEFSQRRRFSGFTKRAGGAQSDSFGMVYLWV